MWYRVAKLSKEAAEQILSQKKIKFYDKLSAHLILLQLHKTSDKSWPPMRRLLRWLNFWRRLSREPTGFLSYFAYDKQLSSYQKTLIECIQIYCKEKPCKRSDQANDWIKATMDGWGKTTTVREQLLDDLNRLKECPEKRRDFLCSIVDASTGEKGRMPIVISPSVQEKMRQTLYPEIYYFLLKQKLPACSKIIIENPVDFKTLITGQSVISDVAADVRVMPINRPPRFFTTYRALIFDARRHGSPSLYSIGLSSSQQGACQKHFFSDLIKSFVPSKQEKKKAKKKPEAAWMKDVQGNDKFKRWLHVRVLSFLIASRSTEWRFLLSKSFSALKRLDSAKRSFAVLPEWCTDSKNAFGDFLNADAKAMYQSCFSAVSSDWNRGVKQMLAAKQKARENTAKESIDSGFEASCRLAGIPKGMERWWSYLITQTKYCSTHGVYYSLYALLTKLRLRTDRESMEQDFFVEKKDGAQGVTTTLWFDCACPKSEVAEEPDWVAGRIVKEHAIEREFSVAVTMAFYRYNNDCVLSTQVLLTPLSLFGQETIKRVADRSQAGPGFASVSARFWNIPKAPEETKEKTACTN
jgi:hypothetical protein